MHEVFFFLPFCSSSSFIALIRCKHIISAVESPVIFLQHIYFTSCRVCLTLLFKKKERKEDEEEAAPAPEWAPVPQTLSNHHYKMIRSVPWLLPVEPSIKDICSSGLLPTRWSHTLIKAAFPSLAFLFSLSLPFISPSFARSSLSNFPSGVLWHPLACFTR